MKFKENQVLKNQKTGQLLKIVTEVPTSTIARENLVVVVNTKLDSWGRAVPIKGTKRILKNHTVERHYK